MSMDQQDSFVEVEGGECLQESCKENIIRGYVRGEHDTYYETIVGAWYGLRSNSYLELALDW